jgi:hypothetical protein
LEAIMMMRRLRIGFASIVSLLALAACVPANASGTSVLILSPSSIRAGFQIEVNATCVDNLNSAVVTSRAFGSITLQPDHGLLMAEVTIPANTVSGTYTVNLACASGGRSTSQLTVLNGAHPNPHHGPDTGGGEMGSMTAAHLALAGGLGTIVVGIGIWIAMALRRRAPARS